MRLVAPQSDGTVFGLRADNVMCLSQYHDITVFAEGVLDKCSCKLLLKIVATVIDAALGLFEV